MNRFGLLAVLVAAAIGFGVAAVASAQVTPSPEPTETTEPTETVEATGTPGADATPAAAGTSTAELCPGPGVRGGEELTATNGASVTPPGGGTYVLDIEAPSGGEARFSVCFVEGNASVTLSAEDCDEVDRENPEDDPGADFVLDLIVDSCEVGELTPTATQSSQGSSDDEVMTLTPTAEAGGISPPSTGDGGLK